MKRIEIKAKAKINLFLEVTGKLENGYHTISTVMHEIALHDTVTVTKTDTKAITITSNNSAMPTDSRNIAYKCAALFFECTEISNNGINIDIQKNIPMEAGLAGGSTDGAAVLTALNQMYSYPLTKDELCALGAKAGADIPFCIQGKAMLCEGIGEIMTPCPMLPSCIIVIAKGDEGVSTPQAYRELDNIADRKIKENKMPLLLEKGDLKEICRGMHNSFEQLVPSVQHIKKIMLENNALGSMMSGSGTAVFGIFDDMAAAQKAQSILTHQGYICHISIN